MNHVDDNYVNFICNRYVTRLASENIIDELIELNIQDLEIIYNKGLWAFDNAIFVLDDEHSQKYVNSLKRIKNIIVQKIKDHGNLFLIYRKSDAEPFINGQKKIIIFSNKAYGDDFVDYFMQQKLELENREIEIDEFDILFFEKLKDREVNGFVLDNGENTINLSVEEWNAQFTDL